MTNEQLIATFQSNRDESTFSVLCQRLSPLIRQFVVNVVTRHKPHLSPNIDTYVEQTFNVLRSTNTRFIAGRNVAPWLLTVAFNLLQSA